MSGMSSTSCLRALDVKMFVEQLVTTPTVESVQLNEL